MLTNTEHYELEQVNKKLALVVMRIKDEKTRLKALKAVYMVGEVLDEVEQEQRVNLC